MGEPALRQRHRGIGAGRAWLDGSEPNDGIALEEDLGKRHAYDVSESANVARRPALTVCWEGPINVDERAPRSTAIRTMGDATGKMYGKKQRGRTRPEARAAISRARWWSGC